MFIHRLFTLLLTVVFACNISKISAQDEIIEHQGNKYIIHVEKLNPDSEMTLLDVLHICPEFFSTDGKVPPMARISLPTISCQLTTSCWGLTISPYWKASRHAN